MIGGINAELRFPGLMVRELVPGIRWEFYKHWGQSYLAGEGRTNDHGDHSGGLKVVNGIDLTNAPTVAQARVYTSAHGTISAVFSYPNGIGLRESYFWEIYCPELLDDVERFDSEEAMESRIIAILIPERVW